MKNQYEAKSLVILPEERKKEGENILLLPVPSPKEIIARRNRIRPVDSGIRAVDRITVFEIRLA